ncbi:response regulator transcription factor [Sphingomonas sp. ASY06-1R]|uniref:response regulator transcription factor n=1 Tax=Sphingomonas sp. ASY06-1R TaxID=3445771 RepID=UPI003FA332D5
MADGSACIRLMVVDDHPVLREGVAAMLENCADIQLVGQAGDGAEAIDMFRMLQPDVVLMDLQMPGINGFEAIAAIRAESPDARILVLTTYGGDGQAIRALRAGAQGYLLKSSLRTEMVAAIKSVHAGRRHIHRDVADEIASHVADTNLSEREIAVLREVARGLANRDIGLQLGVAEETIKAHLKNIFVKLDVADRTHAVTRALQRGMIDL